MTDFQHTQSISSFGSNNYQHSATIKKLNMIRIIIFEDDHRFRDSLKTFWKNSDAVFVAADFAHAENAVAEVKKYQPDVVLMDIQMPKVWGIEAMMNIKKAMPDTKVLILTSFQDDEKVFAAICGGASGYILKGEDIELVEKAIIDVNNGGGHMTPSIALKVMKMLQNPIVENQETYVRLTDRERQVLDCMVKGMSYKMVAGELNIAYHTVHDHVKNIYKKLHVNSAPEAVREAILRKLV
jgi:DNA-binding NarL/FixJ family response regulator